MESEKCWIIKQYLYWHKYSVVIENFLLLLIYLSCTTNQWSVPFGYLVQLLVQRNLISILCFSSVSTRNASELGCILLNFWKIMSSKATASRFIEFYSNFNTVTEDSFHVCECSPASCQPYVCEFMLHQDLNTATLLIYLCKCDITQFQIRKYTDISDGTKNSSSV